MKDILILIAALFLFFIVQSATDSSIEPEQTEQTTAAEYVTEQDAVSAMPE